ncbi:AMP-binding protein [Dactylosporangium sp. AC04546]|uniref:AMP-binding protein n=1 Tax=Dactylosporangium sp. AC04546 TaxID=2862460 RepID=UPI001EDF1DEB|nr:AMP-binding protein [Dactylosporangium sp. AC04546]WVK86955.1 AMP-binding protein [Dactylosporangium sp. AC04546]
MEPSQTLTLGDISREHRFVHANRLAVVDGDVRLTYDEVDVRTTRLANALADVGVHPGSRVLWLGQNSYRMLEVLIACAKLGAVVCPANWRQTAEELEFVINDLDPSVVFWQHQEVGDTTRSARRGAACAAVWIQHDTDSVSGYESFLAAGNGADQERLVDPSSSVLALYTAAFEGRPNAALLSHTSMMAQSYLLARAMDIDHTTVTINAGPLFHVAAYMWLLPTFLSGGTNVFVSRADPAEVCLLIQAERVTTGFLLPPIIERILELNADGRFDLSSYRASARSDPRWIAMTSVDRSPFGRRSGGYGQSEVMALATYNSIGPDSIGSHGRTSPAARVRIVDADMNDVDTGEAGEIVLRGPIVGNGYWNRAELTEHRRRGGWWHTQDLGRREPDGSISFIAPMSRMIKSAAENIYPAEVESCLESHPDVAEAAVIGLPDERWGQSVEAIVVLLPGAAVSAAGLIDFCKSKIASYKKPRSVRFVDSLPSVNGAKDYATLDRIYGGGNYPGSRTTGRPGQGGGTRRARPS